MIPPRPPPQIAVVIATSDRPHMLSARSLPSVIAQTRLADRIVVVDDSSSRVRPANAEIVEGLTVPGREIFYLENTRSSGASGSWNTALVHLESEAADPRNMFIALLDDDDAWSPTYLARCLKAAEDRQLDMVAADLRRFESSDEVPLINASPEALRTEDFLTGNPGIQGSNIFVRLSVLLAAGGFDEALPSTTDRDLCIRVAELGDVRYGRLPLALVDHYADRDRPRLSTPGSSAKREGLRGFWRKYVGRMTAAQRRAFAARTERLFDWSPPSAAAFTTPPRCGGAKKAIVLGLIADNERPGDVLEVVRKLAGWRDETLAGLDVVLLERSPRNRTPAVLDQAATLLRNAGAGCVRLSLERQDADTRRVQSPPRGPAKRRATADRQHELLRAYCLRVAAARTGAEAWLAEPDRTRQPPRGSRAEDLLRWLNATRLDSVARKTPRKGDDALDRWIQGERVATAEQRLRHRFSLENIRLLGCGSEAVVFTDERTVYKCIDYWKTRMPRSQLAFLQQQVDRWAGAPGLYALHDVVEDGPWAVITYEYEESAPYTGGREDELLQLVIGCSAARIVCNNIHPKNLVVTSSGVKLIDYGSDIRPWSPLGFEHMARRAYVTCRHAAHPELRALLRRALVDDQLPELRGYSSFRARLDRELRRHALERRAPAAVDPAPEHARFSLYVGIISADPSTLEPLLLGLASLEGGSIQRVAALILDNGSPSHELDAVIQRARQAGLGVAVVDEDKQRRDAAAGAFGAALGERPRGQVGIARARTMLQRYLGALLHTDEGSFGWVLDDDMRVDDRARAYLPWLPALRAHGADVLIGAYEGSSPNPPLVGLRVQLVDLLHNLHWLQNLPHDAILPDRTAENVALRARFPDYYYDLSRKHNGHLETPHWLQPAARGETVKEAYSRLLAGSVSMLSGAPLTRPLIACASSNPLTSAKDSVNRGGCTFILNPRALSQTPNMSPRVQEREARRSDMIWAIVNRYYRRMTIKAVDFPVHHVGRVTSTPTLNIEKVQHELVGSTLYAGLTQFLTTRPHHTLDFSPEETSAVCRLAARHLDRRLRALRLSFYRIVGLREAIRRLNSSGALSELLGYLDQWFTPERFDHLRGGTSVHEDDIEAFLGSLRTVADDFAAKTVDIGSIRVQLESKALTPGNASLQ